MLAGGFLLAVLITSVVRCFEKAEKHADEIVDLHIQTNWRMLPRDKLPPARLTLMNRVWMGVLRAYLVVAAGLLLFKLFHMAASGMVR